MVFHGLNTLFSGGFRGSDEPPQYAPSFASFPTSVAGSCHVLLDRVHGAAAVASDPAVDDAQPVSRSRLHYADVLCCTSAQSRLPSTGHGSGFQRVCADTVGDISGYGTRIPRTGNVFEHISRCMLRPKICYLYGNGLKFLL